MITVRDDLRSLEGYHSPSVDVAIRLNTNESPVAPPAAFVERLADELAAIRWNRYPDRQAFDLRQAIARHHGVDPAMVFAANGSNEVLQTLLLAFGGAGRRVAVFEPTYQLHAHIARLVGAEVIVGRRRSDFTLDPDEVGRVLADASPSMTFFCSPNNPTGLCEPSSLVVTTVERAEGLVVVDEAYAQFAAWSAIDLVDESRSLVVVRTFSKTWSLAAARLGYLIGPRWLVAELEKVALPYHLDAVKQLAGRLILEYTDEMERGVGTIISERSRITEALVSWGIDHVPSEANFVLFRAPGGDAAGLWQALVDRGVLVRNCSSWPYLDGYLRVTVGLPAENDAFLAAVAEVAR